MLNAPNLVRRARQAAGLTQAQLAERMGTTQTAVARLERPGANPRVSTLERALRAADRDVAIATRPLRATVDRAQIEAQLRLTPEERLAAHERAYRNLGGRLRGARRLR